MLANNTFLCIVLVLGLLGMCGGFKHVPLQRLSSGSSLSKPTFRVSSIPQIFRKQQLRATLQSVLDQPCRSEKISLLGELARVYWERIVIYGLARSGKGIEWPDLIHRPELAGWKCYGEKVRPKYRDHETTYREERCFQLAERANPEIQVQWIEHVYNFMCAYGLPPIRKHSIEEVKTLVQSMTERPFDSDDQLYELSTSLCAILSAQIESGSLPSYPEVQEFLKNQTTVGEIYWRVANKLQSELMPIPNYKTP